MGVGSHRSNWGTDRNDRCHTCSEAFHDGEIVSDPGLTF